jgi:primosomal replication protein N
VPILKFSVRHSSQQSEAGAQRAVEAEVRCVAVETQARQMATAPLGMGLRLAGFLAPQGKSSRQLVLHVTELEFAEGD